MKEKVIIYGGFTIGQTDPAQRELNPVAGRPGSTTLSGDLLGNDAPGFVNYEDNSNNIIFNPPGLTAAAVLDGFVITGGNSDFGGGGIRNFGSGNEPGKFCNPSIRNCSFINNKAKYFAGAILNDAYYGTSNPIITNCYFEGNTAGELYGGAICSYADQGTSNPVITNSYFVNNSAPAGGAISTNGDNSGIASPVLTNCYFQHNTAAVGGAMFNFGTASGRSTPVLINCSFQGNTGSGGAIHNDGQGGTSAADLRNCIIWGNNTPAITNNLASISASHTLFDASSFISGTGNITSATRPFSSTALASLAPCSQAINAGSNADYSTANGPVTDLAGNSRTASGTIDMGAVEYQEQGSLPLVITRQPVAGSAVCAGATVVTDVSVTGSSPAYQWYRNGAPLTGNVTAGTSTLTLPDVTTAAAGSYSVVISGDCPSITSTVFDLTVNSLATPTVTAGPSTTLTCTNPTLTLTATTSATVLYWSTSETTAAISVSQTGTYSVTATGANGCTAISNDLTIGQNFTLPPFTVSSATVCSGQLTSLTAIGCQGPVKWSNSMTGSVITLTAGNSTSTLTATCTVGGCSETGAGQIVVRGIQPPPAQILSFTTDETVCPVKLKGKAMATSFTMTGPNAYVFSTVFREGGIQEAIGLNVKQAGTYTLTATYSNSCGISTPVTRSITVGRSCP